jgi:hypothetical protein
MCACRETDVRKSAEKFHPFYAAAVFPWWLNALYIQYINTEIPHPKKKYTHFNTQNNFLSNLLVYFEFSFKKFIDDLTFQQMLFT